MDSNIVYLSTPVVNTPAVIPNPHLLEIFILLIYTELDRKIANSVAWGPRKGSLWLFMAYFLADFAPN